MVNDGVVYTTGGFGSTLFMFQIVNIVIMLGIAVFVVYIAILLIKFLKRGIRAFEIFIDNYED